MKQDEVRQMIEGAGGKVEEISVPLPDGSGFAIASFPLPEDHWSKHRPEPLDPPMPFQIGTGPDRDTIADLIREAGKYAYHATDLGNPNHDPDAFLQNLVVGMLGYWTSDGTSKL